MKGVKMTTKSENEALGRIDERTKIMAEKLDKVEENTNVLTGIVGRHFNGLTDIEECFFKRLAPSENLYMLPPGNTAEIFWHF